MARTKQVVGSVVETLGVALATYLVLLGIGCAAGVLFGIGAFPGCLLFLGTCLLLVLMWAVRTMACASVGLGKEIRGAVEELEAFWAEAETDSQEEWEEWSEPGTEQLLKDRMGGSLCPCGSGKPYRLCCGKKS